MYKDIIVLARSIKKGGYCVAGVDAKTGEWIRPISNNPLDEGTVPLNDITYKDGTRVDIFDIVRIKLIAHKPTRSQPENFIYDDRVGWLKQGHSSLEEVVGFRGYDVPDKIFYNTDKSLGEEEVSGQPSLLLVDVKNSYINIKSFPGRTLVELNFEYNDENYRYIKISDERIYRQYINQNDGKYKYRGNLSVVFSLTDKFVNTGRFYKMAAQLFL